MTCTSMNSTIYLALLGLGHFKQQVVNFAAFQELTGPIHAIEQHSRLVQT